MVLCSPKGVGPRFKLVVETAVAAMPVAERATVLVFVFGVALMVRVPAGSAPSEVGVARTTTVQLAAWASEGVVGHVEDASMTYEPTGATVMAPSVNTLPPVFVKVTDLRVLVSLTTTLPKAMVDAETLDCASAGVTPNRAMRVNRKKQTKLCAERTTRRADERI